MEQARVQELVAEQRRFFVAGHTRGVEARRELLRRLRDWTLGHEEEIAVALRADLGKGAAEAYMTEIGMVLEEARFLSRHLSQWSRAQRVRTPAAQFPSASYMQPEPYGTVLIMSPWNYPFQLSVLPLLGAIAAGNTAVVKPSAYAPATCRLLGLMLNSCAEPGWAVAVEGGRAENAALLEEKFDYIFFTGSAAVGKLVMEKAAAQLTPVSLELGGKSPVIVDKSARPDVAARRIMFGKCLNAGQTCVAPDYLLVHSQVKDELLGCLGQALAEFYPQGALADPDYPHIINAKHYQRLLGLAEGERVVYGGGRDEDRLLLEPTVLDEVSWESPIMGEEIFGPLLPIIAYDDIEEAMAKIAGRPRPLALYLFCENARLQELVMNGLSFGGGCVNDTIIHLANPRLGFGGVGDSGLGRYHGRHSFATFSHYKSVVEKGSWLDLPLRYLPYSPAKLRWVKRFLK